MNNGVTIDMPALHTISALAADAFAEWVRVEEHANHLIVTLHTSAEIEGEDKPLSAWSVQHTGGAARVEGAS